MAGSKSGSKRARTKAVKRIAAETAKESARPKRSTVRPGERRATGSRKRTPIVGGRGTLVIIGGHEDKEGQRHILRYVAREVGPGKLLVVTAASQEPQEVWKTYEPLFHELGVRHVQHLDVQEREDAHVAELADQLRSARGIFITGGDQLRLTSALGDSIVFQRMRELFERGGIVAGTSAGASAMSETMLVSGSTEQSPRIGDIVEMAPGFGLASGIIVDQHFAERGRTGRLIGAVAQNPRMVGVGIDENTAVIFRGDRTLQVLGKGAVTVVDGADISYTSTAEDRKGRSLTVFGVRLHLLSQGDAFDLETREPTSYPADEIDRMLFGSEMDADDRPGGDEEESGATGNGARSGRGASRGRKAKRGKRTPAR